jgi:hypothetical protein
MGANGNNGISLTTEPRRRVRVAFKANRRQPNGRAYPGRHLRLFSVTIETVSAN